jgi:hypothetical protein
VAAEGFYLGLSYPFPVSGYFVVGIMVKHVYGFVSGLLLEEFLGNFLPHIGGEVMTPTVDGVFFGRFFTHPGLY